MLNLTSQDFIKIFGKQGATAKKGKFKNTKYENEYGKFDSKGEAERYLYLKGLERAGDIKYLDRQVEYTFIYNGVQICTYTADFRYLVTASSEHIIEDFKSPATLKEAAFRIKAKLLRAFYDIDLLITIKRGNHYDSQKFSVRGIGGKNKLKKSGLGLLR